MADDLYFSILPVKNLNLPKYINKKCPTVPSPTTFMLHTCIAVWTKAYVKNSFGDLPRNLVNAFPKIGKYIGWGHIQ